MFIGHFGVALAAKKLAPKTSLPVLILAAEFIDVLWPAFLIADIEHVRIDPGNTPVTPLNFYDYPWTHSLAMAVAWAILFAAIYYGLRRYRTGAVVVGTLVLSHWFLDLIAHRPDLPLTPGGSAYYGLGLWYSRWGTALAEGAIFIAGIWLYVRVTRPRDKKGRYAFWTLIGFLLLVYVVNLQGNAPPSVAAVAWTSLVGTLILLAWSWWADAHRDTIRD